MPPHDNRSLLQRFESAGEDLAQLVLPATGPKDVFDLRGMGAKPAGSSIESLGVSAKHFSSPAEYEQADQQSMAWKYLHLFENGSTVRAAPSLQALLGHLGDPAVQARALAALETFFPTMSLSLNDYADYGTTEQFLEENERYRKADPASGRPPLFANTESEQKDRYALLNTGMWTVYDHAPGAQYTVSAASTPVQALLKAWNNAPHLQTYWKAKALEDSMPAPRTAVNKPRF